MALTQVNAVDVEMLAGTSDGERKYLVTYQAISDAVNDGPLTVVTSPLLPGLTTSLSIGNDFDSGAYPVHYRAKRDPTKSHLHWLAFVTFSTLGTRRNQEFVDDPVDQEPIISGSGVRFSKPTFMAGIIPIVNSAGDLLTDVERDDDRSSLRIERNFNTISLSQFQEFSNAVNENTFFGLPPKSWKLSHPRWEQRFRGNNTPYYNVVFEFETSPETSGLWDLVPIDRGLSQVVANKRVRMKDDNGAIFSTPQLLDGNGAQLGPGLPPVELAPFELYEKKNYAQLGIPTSL